MHQAHGAATVRQSFGAVAAALWLLVAPSAAIQAQGAPLRLRIADRDTDRPLRNAEVINRAARQTLLTSEEGLAALPSRWEGPLTLRIRQVGYHFLDTTLVRSDASAGVMMLKLRRIAY